MINDTYIPEKSCQLNDSRPGTQVDFVNILLELLLFSTHDYFFIYQTFASYLMLLPYPYLVHFYEEKEDTLPSQPNTNSNSIWKYRLQN